MTDKTRYLGKYRGTVFNNVDPERRGRIQALVSDVYGTAPSTFAMPCFPVAGTQMGHFVVPPVGAGVWIEFEQGDKDHPIWSGCWYGSQAEVPPIANAGSPASPNMVLQTLGQHSIVLSDLPGLGITLKIASGATIMINDSGIVISNGQGASISLVGPTVTINQGAFAVT
jgi:uncharacterized protein involved in type VI secretion and phage assembly